MFLLFRVGLEVKSSELMKVGGTATAGRLFGRRCSVPDGLASCSSGAPNSNEAIFVGASMVATSVGITAQVLSAKGLLHAVSSKIILAAAVIDDVLGLLVLAVVSSLTHGKFDVAQLSLTALAGGWLHRDRRQMGNACHGHVTPMSIARCRRPRRALCWR